MTDMLASSHPDVLAFQQVATWPSLGFFGIEPMADKASLLYLADRMESDALMIIPHERYVVAHFLRMLAASPAALRALRPRKRGAPAGRGWNIALHYVVHYKLTGDSDTAARLVGELWGIDHKSVLDNEFIQKARARVEDLIRMRLAGPSWHRQADGSLIGPKEWTEAAILEAMDSDLRTRLTSATRN